jgi:formate dehydrogenase major subunit
MCSTEVTTDMPAAPTFRTRAQQVEKRPPCQAQCPNSGDVRGWIGIIAQHEKNGLTLDEAYDKAWATIAERNPIPASLARICPHPCEDLCTRRDKDGAVSINALERFLGDWGLSRSLSLPAPEDGPWPESIGVVGSGPASLSFAYQMARRGYAVTLYEQDETPGGMLRHAIPDYRLPKEVLDAEIDRLMKLDVTLERNVDVGVTVSLDELRDRHTLLFLGLGAQAGRNLGIPGERGPGVLSGIDFLKRRKERPESLADKQVIVIGGGNTAIDAARSALRDGASVTLMYRRTAAEMPAVAAEIEDARAEGVTFRFLLAPLEIVRDSDRVHHIRAQPMRLGEPDEQGRRRPVPLDGPSQDLPADLVIAAIAQAPDWRGMGAVAAARDWFDTRADGKLASDIWAGGDNRGPGIAGAAIAQGRDAAEAAHAELRGLPRPQEDERKALPQDAVTTDFYDDQERIGLPHKCADAWMTDPEGEVVETITYEEAFAEASRCMSCGLCFDCQQCFMYCNAAGFARVEESSPGNYFALTLEACEGCGKCIEVCPCGYLEARDE